MDHRHLWLRSSRQHAILRIRHQLIKAARDFFDSRGFVLVDTPILTPVACEGTTNLFPVKYFDTQAFLSQSGQLYSEASCMSFGKVYCFGPTFRAEKSKTRRHLTEFWMIEPEVAYADLDDIHRRFDRATHGAFGDAISGQDLGLSLGCTSTVRSHCGYDIGNSANGFHFFDDGFDDGVDVGDAAAACGYGDGLTGFDHRTGVDFGDFIAHGASDVIDARGVEVLSNAEHLRVSRHVLSSCCDFLITWILRKGRLRLLSLFCAG
jgi:hypothetical protein